MSGTQISSDGLAPARKRALFRAWHRGTKEMDLLLGTFADAHLAVLSEADFEDFVQLMEVPDTDLFAWTADGQGTRAPRATHLSRGAVRDHPQTFPLPVRTLR